MNMMITLKDVSNNPDHFKDDRRLEITPEGKDYKKVQLMIVDNDGMAMALTVGIDDLRKALTAIKALK